MTQVAGVHIRSYRGIADVVIPLGRTTVLVGANGAGKSSLLEAMGLIPSEEGAAGRRLDAPPIVDWFIELSDRSVLRASVAAALPPEGADRVIGMLDEVLVVRKPLDGHSTVAVDHERRDGRYGETSKTSWIVKRQTPQDPEVFTHVNLNCPGIGDCSCVPWVSRVQAG